jgi:VIT1/CCC1 family predicted Fe2+/Mn2+ transporter
MPAEPDPNPSAPDASASHREVFNLVERLMEVLFGLIMVLSFTGSLSVATAGREDVREMLIGALGCNLAWGIVDAVMYVMTSLLDRGRALGTLWRVRQAPDPKHGRSVIAGALPPLVASVMQESDLEHIRVGLARLPEPPARAQPILADFREAAWVFLLVFLSTFPVALPFLFISEAHRALRASNAIAVVMLFLGGFWLGRHAGFHPVRTALAMVVIGVALVSVTIALGG